MRLPHHPKRLIKLFTGVKVSWSDTNPLREETYDDNSITNTSVTHKQPMMNIAAAKLWRQHAAWIVKQPLLWRVDINLVFRYPNGTEQIEQRRIVERYKFEEIGHSCDPVIEEAMRYGEGFVRADFTVECLGTRERRESDFGDFE